MRKLFLLLIVKFTIISSLYSQMNPIKSFDFKLLENKVLYIPELELDAAYAKKLMKKEKFDKLQSEQAQVEEYNRIWQEAMAQSSYDATEYEIRGFDSKKIFKEKNQKAIILYYYRDRYGNWFAQLWVAHPKKQLIAQALINGLDLDEVQDIKLMINLLNYSLNEAIELEEEGSSKSFSELRNKYKSNFVEFYNDMPNKTFLVQKNENENESKAKNKNEQIKESLKEWTLCKYKMLSSEEIEKRRLNGDSDSFYWRNFNYYTNSPLITYRYTYLLTTNRDEVLAFFYYLGSKKLKPSTLEKIQHKIIKKGERYKGQLKK